MIIRVLEWWTIFSDESVEHQSARSSGSYSQGGGVLRISGDGDDRRIFLGLKFSIPGSFWVREFGNYFCVWLDSSRDFFWVFKTISRFLVVLTASFVLYHVRSLLP